MRINKKDFFDKVNKTNYCWGWSGYIKNEYGALFVDNKYHYAHRLSWILHNGKIPKGLCVLHKCDNPPCSNPDHLFLGTQADNIKDMIKKGRDRKKRKLSDNIILKIRNLNLLNKYRHREIAEKFNISQSMVSMIVNNKRRQTNIW